MSLGSMAKLLFVLFGVLSLCKSYPVLVEERVSSEDDFQVDLPRHCQDFYGDNETHTDIMKKECSAAYRNVYAMWMKKMPGDEDFSMALEFSDVTDSIPSRKKRSPKDKQCPEFNATYLSTEHRFNRRSLSPWKYVYQKKNVCGTIKIFPEARCLCTGCIDTNRDNKQNMYFAVSKPVIITQPVICKKGVKYITWTAGCTCMIPIDT